MTATTYQKRGPSDFCDLAGVYLDRPALVLCGGPSLPDQVKAVGDGEWLHISANEHGVKLLGDAVDYIVALDNIPEKVYCIGPPVVGFYLWSDYRLLNFWNAENSGMQAVWVAHALGCNPIVIAGADCYSNGTYFWDADAESSGNNTEISSHLQAWQRLTGEGKCNMATIKAAGGPLVEVFGEYEPAKQYGRPQPFKLNDHEWGSLVKPGSLIEILNACAIAGEHYDAGRVTRMDYTRAREVVTLGKARWVKEQDVDRERSGSVSVPDDVRPKRDGRGKRRAGDAR